MRTSPLAQSCPKICEKCHFKSWFKRLILHHFASKFKIKLIHPWRRILLYPLLSTPRDLRPLNWNTSFLQLCPHFYRSSQKVARNAQGINNSIRQLEKRAHLTNSPKSKPIQWQNVAWKMKMKYEVWLHDDSND